MSINNFIKNNQKYFQKKNTPNNNEILLEFNGWQICHIINSYLSNVLSLKYKAKIKSYPGFNIFNLNFFSLYIVNIKWKICNFFQFKNFAVYKSFNVESFFLPNLNSLQKKINKNLFNSIYPKIKDKSDLLNLKIKNIFIGDLIYNSYLLEFKKTINIENDDFKDYLYKSISLFVFWYDYLKTHNVKAIVLTHSVYSSAINLRIALKMGIPTYSANDEIIFKFTKNNLHPWIDYENFKRIFSKLSSFRKKNVLRKSEQMIKSRISGSTKFFFDNYKTSSPFQKEKDINKNRIITKSKNIKILVAAHCFFDSPQIYGKMFFSDFHDWMEYLGKLSKKNNYEWYIKSHKQYFPETRNVLKNFCKKYKKFKLIPPNTSHHKIIKEDIDVALTAYGTIGWEYPFLGIPIILSSTNIPFKNYKFNIQPKNFKEYDKILNSLSKNFLNKEKKKIRKEEIFEFYYMNYLHGKKSWLLNDLDLKSYDKYFKILRTRNVAYSNKIYKIWLSKFTPERHKNIIKIIDKYLDSNKISSNYV